MTLCLSTLLSNQCFLFRSISNQLCVSNDTDVFVILASCLHQLYCKSMYLNWSMEEFIGLNLIASNLDDEKTKA